jgi:hypothetical protein
MELAASEAGEKEFLASLLANLALVAEYSERILASGGLGALCQVLVLSFTTNPKTSDATARTLSRLVFTEAHAMELIGVSGAAGGLTGRQRQHWQQRRCAALCCHQRPVAHLLAPPSSSRGSF